MPALASAAIVTLQRHGVLRLRGVDAASFLHGQLSSDVLGLPVGGSQLAGLHNPQGRAIAVLRLLRLAQDDILALLPCDLATDVLARLRRYVLRAKVTIDDDSASWRVEGSWGAAAAGAVAAVKLADGRCLWLRPNDGAEPAIASATQWELADIAAGLPQIDRSTTEVFVGQMLNLDLVDAISFNKGCYTGQEVIARAHYRGRVKRRMQRFRSYGAISLLPGELRQLEDGRSLRVVRTANQDDGRCEFLAVAPLTAGPVSAEPAADAEVAAPPLACESLSLPYPFP
jgi:folate-binding protein YgfZ